MDEIAGFIICSANHSFLLTVSLTMSLHLFNNVSLSLLLWGHVLKKATLEEEQFLEGEGGAFWKETTSIILTVTGLQLISVHINLRKFYRAICKRAINVA